LDFQMNPGAPISFKPTFVSKKEREKRKKELEDKEKEQKDRNDKIIQKKNKLYSRGLVGEKLQDRLSGNYKSTSSRSNNTKSSSSRKRDEKFREKEKEAEVFLTPKEIELIKNKKLGIKKEKKKVQKPSDKFKKVYVDDWNPDDDTSQDINPIFQKKYEPKVLFGKGMIGGIHLEEQKLNEKSRKIQESINSGSRVDFDNKALQDMTKRDWMIVRENNDILVQGSKVPPPFIRWSDLRVNSKILDAIADIGYEKPTSIQMQAIPVALDKRDLIGIAPTGMGKSCAFLTPMIDFFMYLPKIEGESINDGPYGLILAPTRELAIQIEKEFINLCKYTHLRSA